MSDWPEKAQRVPPHVEGCKTIHPFGLHKPGVVVCADGCPVLARTVEYAREVARERGWLTDEGFIWDRQ